MHACVFIYCMLHIQREACADGQALNLSQAFTVILTTFKSETEEEMEIA